MEALVRYRWLVAGCMILIVLSALPYARKAAIPNHALELWFPEDDPALVRYRSFQERFGNDEMVVLAYRDEDLLSPPQRRLHESLTVEIESIDGVDRVWSLANSRDVVREGFFVRQVTPFSEYRNVSRLRQILTTSPVSAGRLINKEADVTVLWIALEATRDVDAQRGRILHDIRQVAANVLGDGHYHMGGTGVIYDGLNQATERDFRHFVLLTYALIFLIVYVLFRRALFVLYSLLVVAVASLATLETVGVTGRQLTMVTVMLPTVITILGIADVVHVLNWFTHVEASTGLARTRKTLTKVLKPCLYTSLTTAVGFMSFAFTDMPILKEFGLYAAIGIVIAFLATFALGAALLPLARPLGIRTIRSRSDRVNLRRLTDAIWRAPEHALFALGALTLVASAGILDLRVDTYTLGYLPDDDSVVRDHEFLERNWGHYGTLDITVAPRSGLDMRDSVVIAAERNFAAEVHEHPNVSSTFGLHTIVDRYAQVSRRTPNGDATTGRQIREAVRLFESQGPDDLRRIVTNDYVVGRITLTGAVLPAGELAESLAEIQSMAERHFAPVAHVELCGYPSLYVRIIDYIWDAQVQSFWLAVVLIMLAMVILLRDVRLALLALLPNLFPILIMLGAMGYLGIDLDVGTATVAAILLGVAIDDTIHILVHFQTSAGGEDPRTALIETVSKVGRSVISTTIILAVGFSVLILAEVRTAIYFGLLTAIGVTAALIGDLVLLPVLLRLVSARTSSERLNPSLGSNQSIHQA